MRNSDTDLLHCGYIIERLDNPDRAKQGVKEKPRARSCDSSRRRAKLIASIMSFSMGLKTAEASRFNLRNTSSELSNEEFLVVVLLILAVACFSIICIWEFCRWIGRSHSERDLRMIPCAVHWHPVEVAPDEENPAAPTSSGCNTQNRPKLSTFGPPLQRMRLSVSSTALIIILSLAPVMAHHTEDFMLMKRILDGLSA